VDVEERGPYILHSEVKKCIMKTKNKKATDDDDVPGDEVKVSGEDGIKLMTQLIYNTYETGEWPNEFT
jgi:hypothetical protein